MITIDFTGKTALVTGGTRGIGREMVKLLVTAGCRVVYTGTKETDPDTVPGAKYLSLDLSEVASIERFLEKMRGLSELSIVINNAGINIIESIDELNQDYWEEVIRVNLTGAMLIMKEAALVMKKSNIGGKILNISSIFGVVSRAKRNAYSASKAGLIGLTRAAAMDLAKDNILVNALCPGFTRTELTASTLSGEEMKALAAEVPLGRFAEPCEIAKAAVFLCSDLNSYMTGQTMIVDGGFITK